MKHLGGMKLKGGVATQDHIPGCQPMIVWCFLPKGSQKLSGYSGPHTWLSTQDCVVVFT
jgi:hypothetical protein